MIGAAYIFLIVPAHGIVIEQRDLHVEYVSSIDVYVIKFFGRTVSIVSKAGATDVSWIVVNVDDFVGLSCPRVFPSVQDLVRLRVEKEHDLARHHAVAIPLVGSVTVTQALTFMPSTLKNSLSGSPRTLL